MVHSLRAVMRGYERGFDPGRTAALNERCYNAGQVFPLRPAYRPFTLYAATPGCRDNNLDKNLDLINPERVQMFSIIP